jgi:putative phosphotransacetylase
MSETELITLITERVIAELSAKQSGGCGGCSGKCKEAADNGIPIGVSVRHLHITQEDLEILYGPGAKLTKMRDLYQEGEFASKETVTLVGPKMRAIADVRILGPLRKATQVEVARTDAIVLGIDPPVRPSGQIAGSASLTLVGPKGSVKLKEGVICANRHIHMNPADARRFGVKDKDLVKVRIDGDKALTFEGVQVRVADSFKLEMHLDTDDANAAGVRCGVIATIVK